MNIRDVYIIMIGILFLGNVQMGAQAVSLNSISAKTPLPGVSTAMQSESFWLAKLSPETDKAISEKEIDVLNRIYAKKEKALNMPEDLPGEYSGTWLKETILKEFTDFSKKKLYDENGKAISADFWKDLRENLSLESIPPKFVTGYGVLSQFASLRVLPTDRNLNSRPGDIHFDQAQQSGYETGTAHVIYHKSKDGKWLYAQNRSYRGWYKLDAMAICDLEAYKLYAIQDPKVVVSSVRTSVFGDKGTNKQEMGSLRMGAILPQSRTGTDQHYNAVYYPIRTAKGELQTQVCFLPKTDSAAGFLVLNRQNAIIQAFKLLNQSYDWGDKNGAWDCSSLVQSVYQCFGLYLPRNGNEQANALYGIAAFSHETASAKEKTIIDKAIPGLSLVRMPGHIMIYIGSHEGKAFVLHDVHAYLEPTKNSGDKTILINKTVVSDLHLGKGSQKGSWLQRVNAVVGLGF